MFLARARCDPSRRRCESAVRGPSHPTPMPVFSEPRWGGPVTGTPWLAACGVGTWVCVCRSGTVAGKALRPLRGWSPGGFLPLAGATRGLGVRSYCGLAVPRPSWLKNPARLAARIMEIHSLMSALPCGVENPARRVEKEGERVLPLRPRSRCGARAGPFLSGVALAPTPGLSPVWRLLGWRGPPALPSCSPSPGRRRARTSAAVRPMAMSARTRTTCAAALPAASQTIFRRGPIGGRAPSTSSSP